MERKKLFKWFGMFLVLMLTLTLLSRAADSVNVAKVRVSFPQNQKIVHLVSAAGKVESTAQRAVFAKEGQKVEQALVQEGQSVEAGEALLLLSVEELQASVSEQEAEVERLTRQRDDLLSKEETEEEQKALALARAQESYDMTVSNGDINIANAQMEVDVAYQKLQNYYDAASANGTWDSSQEQAYLDEIRAREEALNQAIISYNQEVTEAERAVEDAKAQEATDGTLENAEQELLDAQEELSELQALLEADGQLCAPADGVVKELRAGTGSVTTQEAALILYEKTGQLRMTGTIREEEAEYVTVGQKATVTGSGKKKVEDAVVESIREDEQDESLRQVSVLLPENALNIGEGGEFVISAEEGPYATCVPLSALMEENGVYSVYVLDVQDSVLGEVQIVRKVTVDVLDKNENMAALSDGSLSPQQKVVVDTDREITEGSRVRLQES